jgi:hypothetical protein
VVTIPEEGAAEAVVRFTNAVEKTPRPAQEPPQETGRISVQVIIVGDPIVRSRSFP